MSTLHVTNGDCAADTLRRFVNGPVVVTADVLHEGPAAAVDGNEWYAMRGAFLAGGDADRGRAIAASLIEADRAIEGALSGDGEVVLWFEHDLFDQLQLIRALDLIGRCDRRTATASLICIDRFPGVDRFIGLGQLSADQLESLFPLRRPISSEQLRLGAAAWAAFRAPDPRGLLDLAVTLTAPQAPLPFLGDALLRFLAEYPSATNGLTLTEQRALHVLASGPRDGGALFAAVQAQEPRPFLGDSVFYDALASLAGDTDPLVEIRGERHDADLRSVPVAITATGRDVVAGRADRVARNGISMWRGGVHLEGRDHSPFRWDAARATLVS